LGRGRWVSSRRLDRCTGWGAGAGSPQPWSRALNPASETALCEEGVCDRRSPVRRRVSTMPRSGFRVDGEPLDRPCADRRRAVFRPIKGCLRQYKAIIRISAVRRRLKPPWPGSGRCPVFFHGRNSSSEWTVTARFYSKFRGMSPRDHVWILLFSISSSTLSRGLQGHTLDPFVLSDFLRPVGRGT